MYKFVGKYRVRFFIVDVDINRRLAKTLFKRFQEPRKVVVDAFRHNQCKHNRAADFPCDGKS